MGIKKKLKLLRSFRLSEQSTDDSKIVQLPTELLLRIGDRLPPSAKGCLSLTCKRLYGVFSVAYKDLTFPRECPPNSKSIWTAPWTCHRERYEFLCLLLKDRSKQNYRLCFDCFNLHSYTVKHPPLYRLVENVFGRWLTHVSLSVRRPQPKTWSCSRLPPTERSMWAFELLAGVVDLCPCIKLTPARKLKLESEVRARPQDFRSCWHECEHRYADVQLRIQIWLGPLSNFGALSVKIKYRHTGPASISPLTPRGLCSHQNLDWYLGLDKSEIENRSAWYNSFVTDGYSHKFNCTICLAEVMKRLVETDDVAETKTHEVTVKRHLSEANWPYNVVYLPNLKELWSVHDHRRQ